MTRPDEAMGRRPTGRLALGAVVVAVVVLTVSGSQPDTGRRPGVPSRPSPVPGFAVPATVVPPSVVPARAALLTCPDPSASGRVASRLDVSTGVAGTAGLRAAVGSVELGPVAPAGGQVLERAGDEQPARPGTARQPVVLDADGPVAAGLAATVTGHVGSDSGPVRLPCLSPRDVTTFVGPATVAGRDPLLVVANIGDVEARADVEVLGERGGAGQVDVVVPPGSSVVRRLVDAAAESRATAVSVWQRTGRVVAWLVDRPSRGSPQTEVVVPPTAEPGRRLWLGGLPARGAAAAGSEPSETSPSEASPSETVPSDGSVTLAVSVRGDQDARLDVTMLTEQGPVTPAGMRGKLFTAGAVETVSLRPPGGASFGLVVTVTSGGPVTVAAGVPAAAGDGLRWVGAVADDGLLTGDPHGDVWVPPLPDAAAGSLVLAAPDAAATAWLDGDLVRVPAGRTVTVPLDAGFPGGRLVTVDGPVVAAQQLRPAPSSGEAADGAGAPENTDSERRPSSVTAVVAAPRLVEVPELVPDPRLGG